MKPPAEADDLPLATFSRCQRYRYTLRRSIGGFMLEAVREALLPSGQVTWVMLNPSTADAVINDRTISRCLDFTEQWGYRHMVVVNAYAWRSTDPNGLWSPECTAAGGPVGPENDEAILTACKSASGEIGGSTSGLIVCAWGRNLRPDRRAELARLLAGYELRALSHNDDGSPVHPLYQPKTRTPLPFRFTEEQPSDG